MSTKQTKKGAASMYVVIITTMVVMVIAISLIRIVLAEATRTTNESLSSSAYNSALAGVEDGKTLILKYEKCLDTYGTPEAARAAGNTECGDILDYFLNGILKTGDPRCDAVQVLLYGQDKPEEMKISSGSGNGDSLEQAYSCVSIDSGEDYVGKIEGDRNYRSIPIRLDDATASDLYSITVEWYTKANNDRAQGLTPAVSAMATSDDNILDAANNKFYNTTGYSLKGMNYRFTDGKDGVPTPPPIKLDFFQTTQNFKLSDFYTSTVVDYDHPYTNRFTTTLYPGETGGSGYAETDSHGNVTSRVINWPMERKTADKEAVNTPLPAYCDTASDGYICRAEFEVPNPYRSKDDHSYIEDPATNKRNKNTMLLRISTIYGVPDEVDFRISVKTNSGKGKFKDIQYIVDSTGRANDIYRRVEARVDTADVYFPEPNYELQVGAEGGDSNLSKRIKITQDCMVIQNGSRQSCSDGKGKAETDK